MKYIQPKFYKFSQTSVELARWISIIVNSNVDSKLKICDLFSGCGVVSIELALRLNKRIKLELELVEIQEEFQSYLHENIRQLEEERPLTSSQITNLDVLEFLKLQKKKKVIPDIFVLNPPHFALNTGQKTSSLQRDLCIYMDQKYWESLLEIIDGQCFFLLSSESKLFEIFMNKMKKKIRIMHPASGNEMIIYTR